MALSTDYNCNRVKVINEDDSFKYILILIKHGKINNFPISKLPVLIAEPVKNQSIVMFTNNKCKFFNFIITVTVKVYIENLLFLNVYNNITHSNNYLLPPNAKVYPSGKYREVYKSEQINHQPKSK